MTATLLACASPIAAQLAAGGNADALSRYLRDLTANPTSLPALTGAGDAALAIGDINGALGFYARAEDLAPRNGRVKAGLARAVLLSESPREALKLFDDATDLGVPDVEIAGDRGLAYDLRGDNRRAQKDYALALSAGANDEVTRRYALSLGMSGDRAEALKLLDPLLYKRDQAAWRARMFVLAMTGDEAGATAIIKQVMPPRMAAAMEPFVARIAKLKPAEQAMAVHLGHFPSDGTRYAAIQGGQLGAPVVARSQLGQERLVPTPDPLGAKLAAATRSPASVLPTPAASLPVMSRGGPAPKPAPTPAPTPVRIAVAPASAPTSVPVPVPAPAQIVPAPILTPTPLIDRTPSTPTESSLAAIIRGLQEAAATEGAKIAGPPAPAASPAPSVREPVRIIVPTPTPGPTPKPKPAPAPTPTPTPSARAAAAKAKADAAAKAELAKADAAKKAAKLAKAKPEAKEPSRNWVQVSGGANKADLPKTWRSLVAKSPALYRGKSAWTTPLRATNRLLVGPFDSPAKAQAFVNDMGKAGASGFAWTSPAGQAIEKLPGK